MRRSFSREILRPEQRWASSKAVSYWREHIRARHRVADAGYCLGYARENVVDDQPAAAVRSEFRALLTTYPPGAPRTEAGAGGRRRANGCKARSWAGYPQSAR